MIYIYIVNCEGFQNLLSNLCTKKKLWPAPVVPFFGVVCPWGLVQRKVAYTIQYLTTFEWQTWEVPFVKCVALETMLQNQLSILICFGFSCKRRIYKTVFVCKNKNKNNEIASSIILLYKTIVWESSAVLLNFYTESL